MKWKMMTKYYTGIGSRETPNETLQLMQHLASKLSSKGWTLRSGGADGADMAFENGANGVCDVYLPWKGFNGRKSGIFLPDDSERVQWATQMASEIHPVWDKCSRGAQALHTRNIFQVLGHKTDIQKSVFVVCYAQLQGTSVKGGTRTAVECAMMHGIPVYNLFKEEDKNRILKFLER